VAPQAYVVDNGLFTPEVIACVASYQKPWVADSEKTRLLWYTGRRYNCETFQQTLPPEVFRPVTVRVRGQERTLWVVPCCVRIRRYGNVR
jgi:hypothetical protein